MMALPLPPIAHPACETAPRGHRPYQWRKNMQWIKV